MRPLLGLVLLLSTAAHAQTPADSLRGSTATVAVKDLPDGYRAVSLGDGGFGTLGLYGLGFSSGNGQDAKQSALLFSLMGITFVDPDEFAAMLDGKRPRIRGYAIDFPGMVVASVGSADRAKVPTPTFSEVWIEAGRVVQWSPRPALTKATILAAFDTPKPAAEKTESLNKVKQVALGLIMYAGDYDDRFPKADSSDKAKALVLPYTKNATLWTTPNGGRVLYNTALSGVSDTSIESPNSTLLVWQERPEPDGTRAVGFADGHAKLVPAAEWDRLWAAELARRKSRSR